jgi:hypothetical protein
MADTCGPNPFSCVNVEGLSAVAPFTAGRRPSHRALALSCLPNLLAVSTPAIDFPTTANPPRSASACNCNLVRGLNDCTRRGAVGRWGRKVDLSCMPNLWPSMAGSLVRGTCALTHRRIPRYGRANTQQETSA